MQLTWQTEKVTKTVGWDLVIYMRLEAPTLAQSCNRSYDKLGTNVIIIVFFFRHELWWVYGSLVYKTLLVLPSLLTFLFFVGLFYFFLIIIDLGGLKRLVIRGTKSIGREMTVGFTGYLLSNSLNSLLKCWMANTSFQVFFSSQ